MSNTDDVTGDQFIEPRGFCGSLPSLCLWFRRTVCALCDWRKLMTAGLKRGTMKEGRIGGGDSGRKGDVKDWGKGWKFNPHCEILHTLLVRGNRDMPFLAKNNQNMAHAHRVGHGLGPSMGWVGSGWVHCPDCWGLIVRKLQVVCYKVQTGFN